MRSVRTPTDRQALVCRIATTALATAALTSTALVTTAAGAGGIPFGADTAAPNNTAADTAVPNNTAADPATNTTADPAAAGTLAADTPAVDRTPATPNLVDRAFLHASTYDDKAYQTQMAAINLAHTECHYLDTAGNSDETHEYLAEKARAWAQFPYLFLNSAIDAYCPQHRLAGE